MSQPRRAAAARLARASAAPISAPSRTATTPSRRGLGAGTTPHATFRERLKGIPDLERLAARVACGKATPRDLGALRDALARLPSLAAVVEALAGHAGVSARARRCARTSRRCCARRWSTSPPPLSREGGIIRPGHDGRRDELDALAHSGKRWIAELEAPSASAPGSAASRSASTGSSATTSR